MDHKNQMISLQVQRYGPCLNLHQNWNVLIESISLLHQTAILMPPGA